MRGDLNEQFQRAQSAGDDDNTQKIIIIVAAVVFLCFLAGLVGFVAFGVKTVDKIIETPAATNLDPTAIDKLSDQVSTIYDYGTTGTTASKSSTTTSDFVYGTVEGTTYYSTFSGVSVKAPDDWVMTSYESSIPGRSPKDMSASGDGISIVIQYENMEYFDYETADDALETTRTVASSNGNQLIEDDQVAKWGGNKFKGLIYKKTMGTYLVTYYEVFACEINGYAMKVTISGQSTDDIAIGRSYFS